MQGKVEICGVNTARLKTLTPAKMDELLLKAKDGDETARQALIEGNLRLVLSVIQRFDKRGESPDDLFQVGCIGLIKAISNFDPTKNVRFSTYGVPTIVGCRGIRQRRIYYDKKTGISKGNRHYGKEKQLRGGGSPATGDQRRASSHPLVGQFHS